MSDKVELRESPAFLPQYACDFLSLDFIKEVMSSHYLFNIDHHWFWVLINQPINLLETGCESTNMRSEVLRTISFTWEKITPVGVTDIV